MSPPEEIFKSTERFRLERRLGAGAFGVVYLAYDLKRESRVALKALRQVDHLYRFKQEFRSLADLQHVNLVKLHELLSVDDRWFFTMELVEGVNFMKYVAGHSDAPASDDDPTQTIVASGLPESESVRHGIPAGLDVTRLGESLKQLSEGLLALHGAGKLHRDIKPSNVLVTDAGRVVILDFGLVRDLVRSSELATGELAGTPAYMSPEQAVEGPVSEASDWYSVGVMLFEALTGRLPFSGRGRELLAHKQRSESPAPAELVPSIPAHLNSLCFDLLRRDPAERPKGEDVLRRLGVRTQASPLNIRPTLAQRATFMGRAEPLALLAEAFRVSKSGRAISVLVHGSSGMGKTTLVQHFLNELRVKSPEAVVLAGRCFMQESVPYKGLDSLMDALSSYLKLLPQEDQQSLLPRDILALSRLFPVLRQAGAVSRHRQRLPEVADALEMRRRAFAALRELLVRLAAEHPLVLFIDDLHWSDLDSSSLLEEICRPPDAPELLLIVTCRTEEMETSLPLKSFLESYRKMAGQDFRELCVSELSPSEASALARTLRGAGNVGASDDATIAREAGGNPFFIRQLVSYHEFLRRSGGPVSQTPLTKLDQLIGANLAQVSPSARICAELLAAAGQPIDRKILISAAGVDDHADALDSLRDQHLVRERSGRDSEQFELYHARIGDGVLAGMTDGDRRSRHAALAASLAASGHADPETLFFHFHEAGDQATAAGYAVEAASQAWDALAFDRAARLFQRAIDLHAPNEVSLRVRLGDALVNAGRGEAAARAYQIAAAAGSPAERVELQRRAFEQLLRSGHIDEGLVALREVLATLKTTLPETPKTALLSLIAHRFILKLRGLKFHERDTASIRPMELLRVDACRSVAQGLGIVDNIRGADFQARHLILALRTGELLRIARALGFEVAFSANAGRRARTEELRRRTAELVARLQSPLALAELNLTSGLAAYLLGDWRQAVRYLQEAENMLLERCTGVAAELDSARNFLLRSYAWLGDLNALSSRLPELLKEANERDDLYAATMLSVRNSFIPCLVADDAAGAREVARRALDGWPQTGFHTVHYIYLCVATEIDLYSGDAQSAWKRVTEGWDALRRSLILRVQFARIEFAHLRARCALALAATGNPEAAALVTTAERDAKKIDRESTPWGAAVAKLVRAGAASWRGERHSAAELLTCAEQELESCGMALYTASVRLLRGELIGGEEGRRLVSEATRWMSGQKIVNPARISAMLVPGVRLNPPEWRT